MVELYLVIYSGVINFYSLFLVDKKFEIRILIENSGMLIFVG